MMIASIGEKIAATSLRDRIEEWYELNCREGEERTLYRQEEGDGV